MTPERWKKVEALFERALELSEHERPKFFQQHCNGDNELRREVQSLLDSHARAGTFFDKPDLFLPRDGILGIEGELIGNYRIVRELGRGGMGSVYLAERADQQFEQRVAIKLIKRGMDTDAVLRHFWNERQILASFDHPNIARLFDGGTTDDGLPYFVMEYVDGIPIDKYCDEHQLTIPERLKLFLRVCSAVTYAHRHTVIHRDIKPSNVLVTSDGVPKLLDFGIAKILQIGDGAQSLLTIPGARPMTPEYASPEQIRGEPVTTASDVYSLGVVLYELLTGSSPLRLTTRSPREIEQAITEQEATRPSTAIGLQNQQSAIGDKKLLRGDLDNIVLMALRKEPARRYQSVEQLSEDIRRHLENRPVLARKDTVSYRATKFIRRNKLAVAAAILVLVSLVAGLIATAWQARRATVQKVRAERRFNDVRQLAHSVLFDYHDAIKDLPGATRARERLVKDALTYLDSLAREAAGDPALQRELAVAYERVGDVRGQAYSPSLGDLAGASESYQKALTIREGLVAAAPRDVQNRRDLAHSYARLGRQLIEINQAAQGTDYLRKALAVYTELNREHSANLEIRAELGGIYDELGLRLEDWWGDATGALENHRKALALREELVAVEPQKEIHQRDLSISQVNLGRALAMSADIKGALETNQKGLAIQKTLFAANPNNANYRRLLAMSYQNDGNYRDMLGDAPGALDSFRNKLTLDEQAVAQDPVDVHSCEALGYSCERIGDLLVSTNDCAAGLSQYRRALAMYEKVSAVAPQILHLRYRIAFAHAGIARAQAKLGDETGALTECAKTVTLLNDIKADPTLTWQSSMKARLYAQLGAAYMALANSNNRMTNEKLKYWRTAHDMYAQSLQIWRDLEERGVFIGQGVTNDAVEAIAKCDAALKTDTTNK